MFACLLGCLLPALILLQSVAAESGLFEQANRAYEKGEYPTAIKAYKQLLGQKYASPEVLFNLGNAYFKNGDLGFAIFYYRKAELLAPRDPDIQANLRYARNAAPGNIAVQPGILHRALTYFKLDELTLAVSVFLWAWFTILSFRLWQPQWRSSLRATLVVLGTISVFSLLWLVAAYAFQRKPIAIVTAEQATARFGPLEESQSAFTPNDGVELLVEGRKGEWVQVADRTGRLGWIKSDQVALFP